MASKDLTWTTKFKCPTPTLDDSPVTKDQPDLDPQQTSVTLRSDHFKTDMDAQKSTIEENKDNYKKFIETWIPKAIGVLRDKLDCLTRLTYNASTGGVAVSMKEAFKTGGDQTVSSVAPSYTTLAGLTISFDTVQPSELVEINLNLGCLITTANSTCIVRIKVDSTVVSTHSEREAAPSGASAHHISLVRKYKVPTAGSHTITVEGAKSTAAEGNLTFRSNTARTYLQLTQFRNIS